MTSMVAKACSSSSTQTPAVTAQEKGNRNKRKFGADPPLANPDKIIPLPQSECSNFDVTCDYFEITHHCHTNGCDMRCLGRDNTDALNLNLGLPSGTSKVGQSHPKEELEASLAEFHADWSDLDESQLQDLLLSNLDAIFNSAIKKIVDSGYSEEVANKAILRSGLWDDCKGMVSNIVENTLAYLNSDQDIDSSREHYFEDLKQMENYMLAELVCFLREVRPSFSMGEAMWCLLICDMNVSHACAMDYSSSGSFFSDEASSRNSNDSGLSRIGTEYGSSDPNVMFPSLPNTSVVTYARRSEMSKVSSFFDGHNLQAHKHTSPQAPTAFGGLIPEKDSNDFMPHTNQNPLKAMGVSHSTAEEKFVGCRKTSAITKRDYILRQKMNFEKCHRTHGSKVMSRSGKLSNFGGLVLDKKIKALSDSTGLNTKNPQTEKTKAITFDATRENESRVISPGNGLASVPATSQGTGNLDSLSEQKVSSSLSQLSQVNSTPPLSVADTELSLSFPSGITNSNPIPITFNAGSASSSSNGVSIISSNETSNVTRVPHDRKDEVIMNLAPIAKELQNHLQEWTEWANHKVMQAARRLSIEKAELKTLRQEREEARKLKKEQQTSEESNLKKFSEIENALRKANGQVQRACATVRRREIENDSLRRELEAVKSHAAASAVSCDEAIKREKTMLVDMQYFEKQKMGFQDELAAERRKLVLLQKKLQQAKDARDRAEGKLNQEEKVNRELLNQVDMVKKEREQIEASTKSKEDSIKLRAETNLQKYKDDIMNLEKEISKLRLKKNSTKIAALKRGIDGSYASKVQDTRTTFASKGNSTRSYISKMTNFALDKGVKRDRECVMCLCEEMSVLFLPCAHQVVCVTCNELHKKQGIKDCPSCRTLIRQRVPIRYSRS